MEELRRRLEKLMHAVPRTTPATGPHASAAPRALPELMGGRERHCGRLALWELETGFERACQRHGLALPRSIRDWQAQLVPTAVAGLDPARTLVLDIETGGFSGTEVFLIGCVPLEQRPLRVVQFLARDYPEEEAILRALADLGGERDTWVSFNGKAFDEPFLRDRAARYHVDLRPPKVHLDLLHRARQRCRGQVPNHKLQTLEQHLLGWHRVGDVSGAEIPDLFHHFIRTGNAAPVRPVVEHNQLDLISCTALLHLLA